jgi:hypothetical protein
MKKFGGFGVIKEYIDNFSYIFENIRMVCDLCRLQLYNFLLMNLLIQKNIQNIEN